MSSNVKDVYNQLKNGLKDFQQSDRWKDYEILQIDYCNRLIEMLKYL